MSELKPPSQNRPGEPPARAPHGDAARSAILADLDEGRFLIGCRGIGHGTITLVLPLWEHARPVNGR